MKRNYIAYILLTVSLMWSCSEVKDWQDEKDNIPPKSVTDVVVENINGGAIITYKLPDDPDLLAVKAVYYYKKGEDLKEAYSSAFNNTISLEGFPDVNERTVQLFAIDKSMNHSAPVEVQIKPLLPPVEMIRKSLKVNPTFGGVYMLWENAQEDEISITLYRKDAKGDMAFYDAYYSKAKEGKYTFRGLENAEQEFYFEIKDKWGNYSAPLDTILTPLFEEEIVGRNNSGDIWQRWGWDDKSCIYRGDIVGQEAAANRQFRLIHDGNTWNNSTWWHTKGNKLSDFIDWPNAEYTVMPLYFTIDMGKKASYSRLRYWMRSRSPIFSAQTFTSFEVWGTNNPKPLSQIGDGSKEDNLKYWTEWPEVNGTDEWKNDWEKLADFKLTLPSGATDPNLLTNEDTEFIKAGFEVEMDPKYANEPFRYIRFVVRECREPSAQIQLSELKFWGAYKE
ncbi:MULTISPECIES: DUF5126 domain-containing protein [Bacteroides]|uniref:DUF5126 domain-containing protein n=1 Tax=Bacteroides TaxID=816 RepID=UPI002A83C521|nr:DUF5126 domain-containing protein [Bacteroides nordii]